MRYLILYIIMAIAFLVATFTHAYAGGKHSGQSDQSVQGNMSGTSDELNSANPDSNKPVDNLDSGDFRHASWGMSKDKIKAVEKASPDPDLQQLTNSNGVDALCYKTDYSGYDVLFEYQFAGDSLNRGFYEFNISHSDDNLWLVDYMQVKRILDARYLPADKEYTSWYDDGYKNDPNQWGYAIRAGQMEKVAEWHTDRTHIILDLHGSGNAIFLELIYDQSIQAQKPKQGGHDRATL